MANDACLLGRLVIPAPSAIWVAAVLWTRVIVASGILQQGGYNRGRGMMVEGVGRACLSHWEVGRVGWDERRVGCGITRRRVGRQEGTGKEAGQ